MSINFIVPTGRIIKEYLDEYGITQKDLSRHINVSEKHISNVLNGNSRLTEDFALKIEKILHHVPASYWLNYESKYRESIARQTEKLALENENLEYLSKRFHFKEVFKGIDISLVEQATQMLSLLKISSFSCFDATYRDIAASFMEDGGEKEGIVIWLNLCESEIEVQNEELTNTIYDEKKLKQSLHVFKDLSFNDNTQQSIESCRKLCNKLGIYLVFNEPIINSKVRGALVAYKNHPAIYLSGRFKTHDHIWFAFIHELGHLILHYNNKDTIVSLDEDNSSKEIGANNFAREFFVNISQYNDFVKANIFSESSIREFAHQQDVLPIFVVSILKHDQKISYDKFAYLK